MFDPIDRLVPRLLRPQADLPARAHRMPPIRRRETLPGGLSIDLQGRGDRRCGPCLRTNVPVLARVGDPPNSVPWRERPPKPGVRVLARHDRFCSRGCSGVAMPLPRTPPSGQRRPDDCIARTMRNSHHPRSTSDVALLLLVRHLTTRLPRTGSSAVRPSDEWFRGIATARLPMAGRLLGRRHSARASAGSRAW